MSHSVVKVGVALLAISLLEQRFLCLYLVVSVRRDKNKWQLSLSWARWVHSQCDLQISTSVQGVLDYILPGTLKWAVSSWGQADLQGRWRKEKRNCVFTEVSTRLLQDFAFFSDPSLAASLVLHTNTSAYLFICFACACVCRVHVHACLYIFFFHWTQSSVASLAWNLCLFLQNSGVIGHCQAFT